MRPFLFGPADGRVFGVYHPPQQQPARATAVVICQSFGHEYLRAHRALRNLATALARQGFPVVRFDYYGSGDSGGDGHEVSLARSLADTAAAASELKQQSGASKVAFVGHRFGAVVALSAALRRRDVAAILLWDPVVRGAVYLEKLLALHSNWVQADGRSAGDEAPGLANDVVGFPLSGTLRAEMAGIDLVATLERQAPVSPLHVLVCEQTDEARALCERVTRSHGPSACRMLAEPAEWDQPASIHTALSSPQALQAVAAWLQSPMSSIPT